MKHAQGLSATEAIQSVFILEGYKNILRGQSTIFLPLSSEAIIVRKQEIIWIFKYIREKVISPMYLNLYNTHERSWPGAADTPHRDKAELGMCSLDRGPEVWGLQIGKNETITTSLAYANINQMFVSCLISIIIQ